MATLNLLLQILPDSSDVCLGMLFSNLLLHTALPTFLMRCFPFGTLVESNTPTNCCNITRVLTIWGPLVLTALDRSMLSGRLASLRIAPISVPLSCLWKTHQLHGGLSPTLKADPHPFSPNSDWAAQRRYSTYRSIPCAFFTI